MAPTSAEIRRTFIEFFRSKPGSGDGHVFVPSSPAVPHDDPTLLFTNAGMNQFKPIFLAKADPNTDLGKLKRAVNSQKCIRAGGKHNDLDDVGKDTYHHTFFEMLGNWSFGDYFKAEAIAWSFELLTKVYKIPADRLYATYFQGEVTAKLAPDEETRQLWLKYLPADHVLPGNMKDNFWEMGETGPCGPCTEIHFDRIGGRNARELVNTGDPDVLEIWNNVFIQYERLEGGALRPLPNKHVDTGMGLERLVSVLQNKRSNYDTDVFMPIFAEIERITGARAYMGKVGAADEGNIDTAYRVIADHIRTLTIAITDGAVPSNEGRGYVLRRILRRAVRYGRQILGARTGFFAQLVPVVVGSLGEAFPELKKNPQRVIDIVREEEESFGRTLDRGLVLFDEACAAAVAATPLLPAFTSKGLSARASKGPDGAKIELAAVSTGHVAESRLARHVEALWLNNHFAHKPVISGSDAFKLYDTYGFPVDLTVLMADERHLSVDLAAYEKLMEEARHKSRTGGKTDAASGAAVLTLDPDALARVKRMNIEPTADGDKFHGREIRATVRAIWTGETFEEACRSDLEGKRRVGVLVDKTNFYAEMGGQEADHGTMNVTRTARASAREDALRDQGFKGGGDFRVEHVATFGGYVLHVGIVTHGEIRVGDDVSLRIDRHRRQPIQANHTATHMLNFALRNVLGANVDQKGSLVAPDRLRFDLSHNQPVSPAELAQAESIVRKQIADDLQVYTDLAPLFVARSISGLRAVFGEAYPDPVRVVSIGQPVQDLLDSPASPAWSEVSVEFCGGTHVASTKDIGAFAVVAEEAVAKGVRRVVALTGVPAQAAIAAADAVDARLARAATLDGQALIDETSGLLSELETLTMPVSRKHDLRAKVAQLQDRIKEAGKKAAAAKQAQVVQHAKVIADGAAKAQDAMIVTTIDADSDRAALQAAVATVQAACPRAVVMLLSPDAAEGKVSLMAAVPAELVKKGVNAGEWVREVSAILGGKGGGKPDSAQGGGTDIAKLKEAIATARNWAARKLA